MKQRILFLRFGKISDLPPFIALLDCLVDNSQFDIHVLSSDRDDEIDKIYQSKGVKISHCFERQMIGNVFQRGVKILRYDYLFRKAAKKILNSEKFDIIWIIHEVTAIRLKGIIRSPYILTCYEFNDSNPSLTKKLIPFTREAKVNVACEYNRAHFMKALYKLDRLPFVLPNKPYNHPMKRNLKSSTIVDGIDEKIILYQGQMYEGERNLNALCKAVSSMDGYKLVLMGSRNDYVEKLIANYPKVVYQGYIKAPFHLNVTSHAYIGFVSYDSNYLNTMYCAPNKIWEYSGFGIPMIANDIPGLKYTVEFNHAGLCIDTNDAEEIAKAIKEIDAKYEEYSTNSQKMYEKCDLASIIRDIIDAYKS